MNSFKRSFTNNTITPEFETNITSKVGKWDFDEDQLLTNLIYRIGERNWKEVAGHVPGRTPIQCLHRWTKILRPGLVKGQWKDNEDAMLRKWVRDEGPTKWTECAEFIVGRTGKQCRERWFNVLSPSVVKGNWTVKDDFVIFFVYNSIGSKWTEINKVLSNRTENSIKNRFYSTLRSVALEKERCYSSIASQKGLNMKMKTSEMTEKFFDIAYQRKVIDAKREAEQRNESFDQEQTVKLIEIQLKSYLSSTKQSLEPLQMSCQDVNSVCASGSVSGIQEYFNPANCYDFDNVSLYNFSTLGEAKDDSVYEQQLNKHLRQIQAIKQTILEKYKGFTEIKNDTKFKKDILDDFLSVKHDLKALNKTLCKRVK